MKNDASPDRKLAPCKSRRSSSMKRGAAVETIVPLRLHIPAVTSDDLQAITWCLMTDFVYVLEFPLPLFLFAVFRFVA